MRATSGHHARSSSAVEVKKETVMTGLSIGAVAAGAGLRPSALRYYEQAGLLPPPLRENGRRSYDPAVFDRLALIGHARRAGFTISDTRRLLSGFAQDAPPNARWRAIAQRKDRELDAVISHARRMQRILRATLKCQCPTLDECGRRLRRPSCPRSASSPSPRC
jgi:MerR family redox-sensitive transcriptional activator SoxR